MGSLIKLILRSVCKVFEVSLGLLWCWIYCLRVVEETFFVYHVLKDLFGRLEAIPAPIKGFFADDLLLFVMETIKVRVSKTLFNSITLIWIESQHFRKEISSSRFDVREKFLPVLLWPFGKRLNILDSILIPYVKKLLPMYFISSELGVPRTEIMRWTWSRKSSPGKRGCLPKSSAKMQPMDQISTAFVYSLALRIT